MARHPDRRPDRCHHPERARHGRRGRGRPPHPRFAGAGAGQVRRLRFGRHSRHALGGRPERARRARQPEPGACHQPQSGRRRCVLGRLCGRDTRDQPGWCGRGGCRRQHQRGRGQHASQLHRRDRRGRLATSGHQGRLFRPGPRDRDQRAGGQLRQRGWRVPVPAVDHHQQRHHHTGECRRELHRRRRQRHRGHQLLIAAGGRHGSPDAGGEVVPESRRGAAAAAEVCAHLPDQRRPQCRGHLPGDGLRRGC